MLQADSATSDTFGAYLLPMKNKWLKPRKKTLWKSKSWNIIQLLILQVWLFSKTLSSRNKVWSGKPAVRNPQCTKLIFLNYGSSLLFLSGIERARED